MVAGKRAWRAAPWRFAIVLFGVATFGGCAGIPTAPAPLTGPGGRPFHVIAHRGGAGHAPENTLPAFRRSLALGFHEVELDLRLSLDEQVVLYHDYTLERKTGKSGSVGVYTAEELRAIDIGSWFDREHPNVPERFFGTGIVSLADLFAEFGDRLYYHLEIKGEDVRIPPRLLEQIDAAGLRARVTVTSFSKSQVERFRRLAPGVPVCWLLERNRDLDAADPERDIVLLARHRRSVDTAAARGFEGVAIRADELGPEIVRYARERGVSVRAWGVKTAGDEDRVIRSDSDGATTDWPVRLRARLTSLGSASPPSEFHRGGARAVPAGAQWH